MLCNVKSPALYWQAAFRAQNAWQYEKDGQIYQKKNAYVFDFAPERTLIIYDEFANNLSLKTSNGGGTAGNREENIRQLLNFFPVIAEDTDGEMVELDVGQVLTIPKVIKAQEVVRKGFLSNLLFQNVGRIFGAHGDEIKEILEQINPAPEGKSTSTKTDAPIDTQNVQLDDDNNALINHEMVINTNNVRFGEKIYGEITKSTDNIIADALDSNSLSSENLATKIAETLKTSTESTFKEIAKEHGVTDKFAEKVVKEQSQAMAYEVQKLQKQSEIEQNITKTAFENQLKTAKTDDEIGQITKEYQAKTAQITQNLQAQISEIITDKVAEFTQNSTQSILQKSEQQKQQTVEDDIRSRLRGFSRTIPSFLMAYGNEQTTLANFDTHITDAVFKEVTGITLEQFRTLRDKHQFFDPQVFDTSVQTFLQKRIELANYFDESQSEDIFDFIPPQRTNQIFTPKWVVKMMLDKFEQENPDIFSNPDTTFVDLYMKSGLYLTEIVKRLYEGLKETIPDDKARLAHIFAKQIYGFAPSEIIYQIAKNFILGFDDHHMLDHSHIVFLDTTPYAKGELDFNEKLKEIFGIENMRFDVVVGNPPYQESRQDTRDDAIYNYFYDLAEQISDKYCLISPARFLFNAGSTDRNWNEKMLNDKHLKVVFYEQNSSQIFPNTDIKGGIAIICRDRNKDFGKIGTFTSFPELNSIAHKVAQLSEITLDMIMSGQGIYRFTPKMHQDNPNVRNILSKSHPNDVGTGVLETLHNILFFEKKPNDGFEYVEVLGRYQNQRVRHFIRKDYINEPFAFDKFKVILPKANGSGAIGEVLSTPLIGFTQTFISIGVFENRLEAENCLKYVKSKFARTMLGILKITQDNPKDKWKKVPLQDFTADSDVDWTPSIADIDKQLYAKYGLSDDEIRFIEEKVREMT